jgi:hypothetical protein
MQETRPSLNAAQAQPRQHSGGIFKLKYGFRVFFGKSATGGPSTGKGDFPGGKAGERRPPAENPTAATLITDAGVWGYLVSSKLKIYVSPL